ncbi:RsmE family RNA methyltransferase [Bdellovibrionota bacterium FG-2]
MKRVLCDKLPEPHGRIELSTSESQHVIQVLRMRNGDEVEALDGQGGVAHVYLEIAKDRAFIRLKDKEQSPAETSGDHSRAQALPIRLEAAILKGDAMEWLVEKAVELGVEELIPVITDHTVVQVQKKGASAFQERWQKIADQSLKQCGRLVRLRIAEPIELEKLLVEARPRTEFPRLWADEGALGSAPFLEDVLVAASGGIQGVSILIGPEGGWSSKEQEMMYREEELLKGAMQAVSLGPWILRGETAGLFAVSVAGAKFRAKED